MISNCLHEYKDIELYLKEKIKLMKLLMMIYRFRNEVQTK